MSDDLPRITKRELERVGIRLVFEDDVRAWKRRGWAELQLFLWNYSQFEAYERYREIQRERLDPMPRIYEEDGA